MMDIDKRILIILFLLLIGQGLWLANDMKLISLTIKNYSSLNQNQKKLGELIQVHETVKKRPLDNPIWNRVEKNEPIRSLDSILTLENSSALVRLSNGTEILISENNLISFEIEDKASDTPVLQMKLGGMDSKTIIIPEEKSQIVLNQKISKNGEKTFDLQVLKGEVKTIQNQKIQNFQAGSHIEVRDQSIAKTEEDPVSEPIIQKPPTRGPTEEELLEAPEIKKPQIKKKRNRSGWFSLLIPQLFAESNPEPPPITQKIILLSWEKVPNAEKYLVEIAEDEEFELNRQTFEVEKNEMEWTVNSNAFFYWRVAGMKKKKIGKKSPTDFVSVRDLETSPSDRTNVQIKQVQPQPAERIKKSFSLSTSLLMINTFYKDTTQTPLELLGPEIQVGLALKNYSIGERTFSHQLTFQYGEWKAQDRYLSGSSQRIKDQRFVLSNLFHWSETSSIGIPLVLQTLPWRTNLEEIGLFYKTLSGIEYQKKWHKSVLSSFLLTDLKSHLIKLQYERSVHTKWSLTSELGYLISPSFSGVEIQLGIKASTLFGG